MYLFASLTSVFAWERVYPHKFEAVFRSGLRHSVQAQNLSVQSTAENLTCPVSLPEQKPASNFRVTPISMPNIEVKPIGAESTWLEAAWEDRTLLNKEAHHERW